MQIIPAIDLRGGNVVRLFQGDYDQETIYTNDAADIARQWRDGGANLIHLVDLDGAKDGRLTNEAVVRTIVESTDADTELGGGLRDIAGIGYILEEVGVTRAILGSILLENPKLVAEAAKKYPNRIVLGIDARDGMMSTRGWRSDSKVKATDLVLEFKDLPIAEVIYTDIARDGTLAGPNLEALQEMAEASPFPVIASGGIGDLGHITSVAEHAKSMEKNNVSGIIVGKALYENKFTVAEAIAALG